MVDPFFVLVMNLADLALHYTLAFDRNVLNGVVFYLVFRLLIQDFKFLIA